LPTFKNGFSIFRPNYLPLPHRKLTAHKMTSHKNTASNLLPKGTERTFAHMDIQHQHFPISLFLTREVLMDNVRHQATEVRFTYEEQPSGDYKVTIRDNGDGNAVPERLIAPAETSGVGTARYGFGLRIYRLKNAGQEEPFSFTWKKTGDAFFHMLEQNSNTAKPMNAVPGAQWSTIESHGFTMTHTLLRKNLEGLSPSAIAPTLREIMCMSMTPETLAGIRIHVEVLDKTGVPVCEAPKTKAGKEPKKPKKGVVTGIVDSVEDKWQSLLQVLEENHEGEFPSMQHTLSKKAVATARFYKLSSPPPKSKYLKETMPTYTNKNAHHALVVQDGFVTDIPLANALDRAPHASSMNGRYLVLSVERPLESIELPNEAELSADEVFEEKERIRQDSILIPASSKLTFVGETYTEALEFVRKEKPSGWVHFEKKKPLTKSTESDTDVSKTDTEEESKAVVPVVDMHATDKRMLKELLAQVFKVASRLPTEVFNVPLEGLEDWFANDGNLNDEL